MYPAAAQAVGQLLGSVLCPCGHQMLSRVYTLLHTNNPELIVRTRVTLPPPEICRVGSTRSAWVNFDETCNRWVS